MRRLILILTTAILIPFTGISQDVTNPETMARSFFDHFLNKDVEAMETMLGEEFLKIVPPGQLKEIADGIEGQLGKYSHVIRSTYEQSSGYESITLVTRFGEMDWGVVITFDQNMKIQGFRIIPAPPEEFTPAPEYADPSLFTETEMVVDCGDIQLPAMLTMPNNKNNVPVVVLVHGSGAHDMDETIGPNKIFRDIAHGLATKGIAVLRYEKRNFKHHNTLDTEKVTVWDEAGHDAVQAIQTAAKLSGVDPNQIYLAGHSLGGMLAPRIALEAPELAGIISLAGSPRYLYEFIPEQLQYLAVIGNDNSEATQKNIAEAQRIAATLAAKRNDPNAAYTENHFNIPASYWQDMNKYDIGPIAASLPQSILILHGGRDYQVTMKDWDAWHKDLEKHPKTFFVLFPDLDHLFIKGEGLSNPMDYFQPNNVDQQLVNTMAEWIMHGRILID